MGNDGGSIPTRRELVKEAARNPNVTELKEKQKEHLAHRWSQCPVSHKALTKPVVSDYTGDLYNKDVIIQFLLPDEVSNLDKAEAESFIQGRIKSLKDTVEVHFEVEQDEVTKTDKWMCPITRKELGISVRAVYLVPCGHAFSQEAIKEMKSNECVQCGQTYEAENVVPILSRTEVDKTFVMERMERLKAVGLTHSLKKASGGKKRKAKDALKVEGDEKPTLDTKITQTKIPEKSNGSSGTGASMPKSTSTIKNTSTANLTAKVLEEEEAKKKRRILMGENENIKSLFSKSGQKHKDGDFMTRGFSIPADARHQ